MNSLIRELVKGGIIKEETHALDATFTLGVEQA